MTEDEELLRTLAGDEPEKKSQSKGKAKKSPKNEEVKIVKSIADESVLNPREEFLDILRDVGLKRGIEVMADVFYSGDINDPSWLDRTLSLGGVSVPHRRLILTGYYGASPEDMGIEMVSQSKSGSVRNKKAIDAKEAEETTGVIDIKKTMAQQLKDRLETASMRSMMRELAEMESEGSDKKAKKVIERPLISDGEIVMKDGIPVMERIITQGDSFQSGGSDLSTMLALLKVVENKKYDPDEKPKWALDLENQLKVNKAEEDKRRLEDELRKEKDKRDDMEKEYKKEIEKTKEQHEKDINNFAKETTEKFESIRQSFKDELKHRDEMDILRSQFGEQFTLLKEELDFTKKDIKSAVVTEVTRTGAKVVDKFTDTVDGVVTPMASVVKDMYKLQIDNMRRAQGLDMDNIVPSTTEEELEELL